MKYCFRSIVSSGSLIREPGGSCPDGNHWACGIQDDNQHFAVLLDGKRKPSVAMNRGDSLSFDADGKRLMLLTQREGNKVQVDCFTGSSGETVLRSGDGKHTAFASPFGGGGAHVIVDGNEGPGFRAIHDLAMSPDEKQGLIYESVQEQTEALEFQWQASSGKLSAPGFV
jgi:hypothetical protein